MLRKILFWLHLTAGSVAGIVIFVMSLTGVLLAFERQAIDWADRRFRHASGAPPQPRLSPETLLARAVEGYPAIPTALTIRSDPRLPASVEFGRGTVVYLDPGSAAVLGEGSSTVRAFFREIENWHRWLAAGLESRALGRGVTGACNLLFLGLLLSGAFLWLPKAWSRQHLRPAIWFRLGLRGKARDWNWHNTLGIWCLAPLLVVVASGVVMSYPWVNNLVYRITGSEVPQPGAAQGRGTPPVRAAEVSFNGIDPAWRRAETQVANWRSISLRVPPNQKAPLQFTIDSGNGGRPDLRAQLTLKRGTGDLVRWEPFQNNSAGRRLRSWLRFAHTGEAAGILGQSVAALASLGALVLVWTGTALVLRRMAAALARRRTRSPAFTKSPAL